MKRLLYVSLFLSIFSCTEKEDTSLIDINKTKTQSGWIAGKLVGEDSIKTYLGIPFAAPPVGDLRWKAPQPVTSWTDVKQTTTNPPSAIQNPPIPFFAWSEEFLIPKEPISEDCLYLNVWTGADQSVEKRPVMVWIHGGGFTGGSGTVPLYDGEELAKKGIVVVTINYRLGALGFMAHPELTAESPNNSSGNYGILDQIAALEWVKNNIEHFGGDPENITIAGQSAGAFSVNALVASPLAKDLFTKAIAQSGGMFKSPQASLVMDLARAEKAGLDFASSVGASSIADLRDLSADSILHSPGRFGVTLDGKVIPASIDEAFANGQTNEVTLLTGWNQDDNVSFGPPITKEQFQLAAKQQYGDLAEQYLTLFPASTDEELAASQKMLSGLFFGWQNYTWARNQVQHIRKPVYVYYFTHVPPGEPNYGAFHSAEFAYAFHTLKYWNRPFTSADYTLESNMSDYWVNFVKTGNPNGEGLANWPEFSTSDYQVMYLDEPLKVGEIPMLPQLQFLEKTMD